MHFDIALGRIFDFYKKNNSDKLDDITLYAVITHWLQNPISVPIFLSNKDKQEWIKILNVNSDKDVIIDFSQFPFLPNPKSHFNFIDLFAGIGGFRLPLQEIGGRCVFTSEWDKAAQSTYFKNFGEYPFGDIRKFTNENISDADLKKLIPKHDVLAAGFPCQPFSHAGVSARGSLGLKHGFEDEIQGTLFFDVVRIAKIMRPSVLLLENVRNLKSHDNGKTFEVIKKTITDHLGYSFEDSIIDSSSLVPQRRKRCFMVCYRDKNKKFEFPKIDGKPLALKSILETNPLSKYTISDKLWAGHQRRTANNLERGTGFTAFTADIEKPSNTIVARYGKDGKECLIPQEGKNPRKLTPRECARLLGFPENFILPDSDAPSYKQFGNSVVVPVVKEIVKQFDI
ncbi:MAG: DNA (cytosine-5-)-methyltransferase [Bacteriovoracaceae bacterium]|nr:DNA (cytosine-5-)-methyltransferase [Bacteriovoracaceae bacterium]